MAPRARSRQDRPVHDANPEERHGEVRQEGAVEGQEGDGRTQGRNVAQRPVGQEGDESQAGDRHRPFGSASCRRKGAAESEPIEEIVGEEIEQEIGAAQAGEEIRNEEIVIEEEVRVEAIGDEEVVGPQVVVEALVREEIDIEEEGGKEVAVAKVVVEDIEEVIVRRAVRDRLRKRLGDRAAGAGLRRRPLRSGADA